MVRLAIVNPETVLKYQLPLAISPKRQALAALRAQQWKHFLLLPLASFAPGELSELRQGALRILGSVLLAALALGWSYGLNSLGDRMMDQKQSKNVLAGQPNSQPWALLATLSCLLLALGLAWSLGKIPLIAAGISLGAGTVYSWGPRLKRFPGIGSLLNLPIFIPLLVFGVSGPMPAGMPLLVYCFALLLLSSQLLHEWEDREEDQKGGIRSTALLLGERRLRGLVLVLGFFGAAGVFLFPGLSRLAGAGIALAIAGSNGLALALPSSSPRALHRKLGILAGAVVMLVSSLAALGGATGGLS